MKKSNSSDIVRVSSSVAQPPNHRTVIAHHQVPENLVWRHFNVSTGGLPLESANERIVKNSCVYPPEPEQLKQNWKYKH